MQDLVGKLTAFDPEASESLKVIAYFDTLIAGGVGLDGLLSGAAVLSGTVAGAELRDTTVRQNPEGRRVDTVPPPRSPERRGEGWSVWLEREGNHYASDEMIVERLAIAVDLIAKRQNPDSSLEIVINDARSDDDRASALARLQITPSTRLRLIATPADDAQRGHPSTVVATRYGMLRATVDIGGQHERPRRGGIGTWENAERAALSWANAVVAFRLARDDSPVVDAADLGAMLLLARSYDPSHPPPDVTALQNLDERSLHILITLAEAPSIRAAAVLLNLHHSSLQARHASLTKELGFDVRTTGGRLRFGAAELLRRLT